MTKNHWTDEVKSGNIEERVMQRKERAKRKEQRAENKNIWEDPKLESMEKKGEK